MHQSDSIKMNAIDREHIMMDINDKVEHVNDIFKW